MQGIAAVRARRAAAQHLEAVEVGQLQVDQHQVGTQRLRPRHAGPAGRLGRDRQAGHGLHQLLDQQHVDLVVLDVEDLPARSRRGSLHGAMASESAARARPRRPRSRSAARTSNTRAFAALAAHRDAAAHAFDQRLDDGEADARAFDALVLGAEAVERLEQAGQLVGVRPRPVSCTRSTALSPAGRRGP
jgi:hypothetical protein